MVKKFVEVLATELKCGDKVFVTNTKKSHCFLVLDVGHPFILLENLNTHWASLYHPVKPLYKEVENGNESE